MDSVEKLYHIALFSNSVHNSTAQVDAGGTYKFLTENTILVGAKRLRLRGSVAPAKVHW